MSYLFPVPHISIMFVFLRTYMCICFFSLDFTHKLSKYSLEITLGQILCFHNVNIIPVSCFIVHFVIILYLSIVLNFLKSRVLFPGCFFFPCTCLIHNKYIMTVCFEMESHYHAQIGLELLGSSYPPLILPITWNYSHVPLCWLKNCT